VQPAQNQAAIHELCIGVNMPDQDNRDARYKAQTAEQFEAIGRFVQSFELMVDVVRNVSHSILSGGDEKRSQLINVVLFHQSMTAKPLFEIMRGLYGLLIREYADLFKDDKDTLNAVLKFCASEYEKLANLRNDLLHGTWRIGWATPDQEDFGDLIVHRARVWAGGYKFAELPKTTPELRQLAERCDELRKLFDRLWGAVTISLSRGEPSRVRFNVRKENDKWLPQPPDA
jgi:hypothetical protein